MKHKLVLILIFLSVGTAKAQNSIDKLSKQILENNEQVIAYTHYIESIKLAAKTGIFPKNPEAGFNYLFGSPPEIGNQIEFSVIQAFDFPTAYAHKSNISELELEKADLQFKLFENTVLLEIQKTCIEQIYLNRKKTILLKRLKNDSSLNKANHEKFANGEINQIELNKSQMQFLTRKNELLTVANQLLINNQKLSLLNGRQDIVLNDTAYVFFTDHQPTNMPDLLNQNNTSLQISQIETQLAKKSVSLEKSYSLPKFEIGYLHESIGNQTLKGFHTGLSIPIWENKNRIKLKHSESLFKQKQHENLERQKELELQQKILSLQQKQLMYDEWHEMIKNHNSPAILMQQLESGLISVSDYYTALSYFYQTDDKQEELLKEYYILLAELQNAIN